MLKNTLSMTLEEVLAAFNVASDLKPVLYRAPARINLIGEHTDYNDGFVMPAAVDRQLFFAIAPNQKNIYELSALEMKESVNIDRSLAVAPEQGWAKYFFAVLEVLKEKGFAPEPVTCVFGGNIPIGSGMSSSAALTCGFAFALNDLFDWKLSRLELAKIGQAAEHRVGIKCGLMDQYAVLFGKEEQVVKLDCQNNTHEYAPLKLGDYRLVLFNSMVQHSLADTAYNDRRKSCESVLDFLNKKTGVTSLKDLSLEKLAGYQSAIDSMAYQRVRYVLMENQRVLSAQDALATSNLTQLGKLLYASHEGLSKEYEVSCEELDFLVDQVRDEEGVLGARMMGGGFGGCTINLIHLDYIETIQKKINKNYEDKFGRKTEMTMVVTADGISKI